LVARVTLDDQEEVQILPPELTTAFKAGPVASEYVFIDEWTSTRRRRPSSTRSLTPARIRTGGRPYIGVEADGPVQIGAASRHEFKGRLP
jgi:hypothetical protein